MASENIKATEDTRKKHAKAISVKTGLYSKLNYFCWINEKYLNKLENSSVRVASFYIKLKVLNNKNLQMQK